jgi:VIT1/CCC1 family predicted Fe2+/Mn2+ transporter
MQATNKNNVLSIVLIVLGLLFMVASAYISEIINHPYTSMVLQVIGYVIGVIAVMCLIIKLMVWFFDL